MKRFSLILTLVLCGTNVWAKTLLVPSRQYPTIQSAINATGDGDIVVVSPGTYYENINFHGKAITVRSVNPDDPNVVAATVINGSLPADPNIGSVVTFASGEDANSVLSGFTITGGTGTWLPIAWDLHQVYWNRCGGGAVCCNMSAPTISRNVFINNIAGQGGGIYVYGDPVNPDNPSNPSIHVKPVIIYNTFISNSAIVNHGFTPPNTNYPNGDHGDGGAIVGFQGCDAAITGNLIQDNHADWYGGGIHLRQWSRGQIQNNHVIGNNSSLGAGIHVTYNSEPNIVDNLIESNIAGGLGGGGIYIYYLSKPLVERNIITQNTSGNGAGIGVYWESTPTIRDNLIYKNNSGAGIRIVSSAPKILNNTITNNIGGIATESGSDPIIKNNIITSNGNGYGIYVPTGNSPIMTFNDVWGNKVGGNYSPIPDQTGINGNISVTPDFVNPDNNDYHLSPDSNCIDAGDPNFIPAANEKDYDGDQRLMRQYVDIGADETGLISNITTRVQYQTIQQAIDEAGNFDVIVVSPGIYTGNGNRDISFRGKSVTVQSLDPDDPCIAARTIIDCQGSDSNPHRGFHFYNNEDANSILDGLTITGGGGMYDGGAIRCYNHSSPTIRNCIITNNLSGGRAGGIYCYYSSPAIINCKITNNAATRGYGGGICCEYGGSPTIANCIITGNSAVGYHHGGGICCWGDQNGGSNPIVVNCIVSANSAGHRGGGLYAYWSDPVFVNCTVIGNKALEGGGIGSFRESNPAVINCIVRDNIAPDGNQLALINTSRVWPVSILTEMTVTFSDIEGGQKEACIDQSCILHWGSGNIDIDPNFTNGGYWDDANTPTEPNDDFFVVGNYHLLPTSNCIDVGDNNSVTATTDIDGEQRIFNGIIDMGADEFVTNPFDLNNDGVVDYLELAVLVNEWLQSGSQLQADFHKDSFVDLLDYAELANQWLWKGRWLK